MAEGFVAIDDTLEELAKSILDGWAFSYQFIDEKRNKDNFIATDILAIDVDNGYSISEVLKNPIVSAYCSLLYTTFNHTPDHHKYRLIFVLPRTITHADELRAANVALAHRLQGDLSATDPARMFYGNTEANIQFLGKELTNEYLDELIQDSKTTPVSDSSNSPIPVQTRSSLYLGEGYNFLTSKNQEVKFSEFTQKTSIYCPFHLDNNPSAFLAINIKGDRFMHCSTCRKTYWMGQAPAKFDFDEFEHVVKAFKENPPIQKIKTNGNNLFDETFEQKAINTSNIIFDQKKYIDLQEIKPGITFVKSPKGSGKTTFLQRALEKVIFTYRSSSLEALEENDDPESPSPIYSNKRILLIGHRQALIREMCQRLYLFCYLDYDKSHKKPPKRFGVCLDSLHMALENNDENTAYDLIIIDESEQVLSHFLSETIGTERTRIFTQFQSLLQNAKSVVALDADLGWISFNTITRLVNSENNSIKPNTIYINHWEMSEKPIYVYRDVSQIIDHIRENILAGKRIFISSNSKAKILSLEESIKDLARIIDRDIETITVTSENSKTSEVQKFITNIKKEIIKYQVVLSSPSLGTGIDITFDNDENYIDCVYGLYENRINTHTEIDQQLGRVRHPKEVHVWVSARTYNFETEFEAIKAEYLENNFNLKLFNEYELNQGSSTISSEGVGNFMMMAALITSYQRASKNNLKLNFLQYKRQQGWKIFNLADDYAQINSGKAFYRIGKSQHKKNVLEGILNAKPLKQDEFESVLERLESNDDFVSRDEINSYQRTAIEVFYRQKITEHLIEQDNNGELRRGIRIFETITDKERIKEIAATKLKTGLNSKEFNLSEKILVSHESKSVFIYKLMTCLPFFKDGEFHDNVDYGVNDLENFANMMVKMKPFIENHLNTNIRKDIRNKPTQQLKQILNMIGLDHRCAKKYVKNGVKYYRYRIYPDKLNMVKNFVKDRKRYSNEWDFYNKLHGFKNADDDLSWLFKERR